MTTPNDLVPFPLEDQLIIALPSSDYGRVFLSRIEKWLKEADEDYFLSLKICDDDIRQDFRFKAGVIYAYKKVLNEPKRVLEQSKK